MSIIRENIGKSWKVHENPNRSTLAWQVAGTSGRLPETAPAGRPGRRRLFPPLLQLRPPGRAGGSAANPNARDRCNPRNPGVAGGQRWQRNKGDAKKNGAQENDDERRYETVV